MPLPSLAYWFAASPILPHNDGRPIVIGGSHTVLPPIQLCYHGLHWSEHPFDALHYAPGNLLYKVEPFGDFLIERDKGCSTGRKYLAVQDATKILQIFARECALSVLHLWNPSPVVKEFLTTGDTQLAADAAYEADAAEYAAYAAANAAYAAASATANAAYAANAANAANAAANAAEYAAYAAENVRVQQRNRFAQLVAELFSS